MNTFNSFRTRCPYLRGSRACLFGLVCAIGLSLFAPGNSLAQGVPQRDQQALTILIQTIAIGGGQELLASIHDLTQTGTATYHLAEEVTCNITVKSSGLHRFRIDADLPAGRRTTVVNGETGSVKEASGVTMPIYRQSAEDLGTFTIPYPNIIVALQDSSMSIIYRGLITHDGVSMYDIRLQKVYTKEEDPGGIRGVQEARDFYINPQTYLVFSISDRIHLRQLSDGGVPHETFYSNYQPISGAMLPMTIIEAFHSKTAVTLNLNQASFNSGLADSDFTW